MKLRCMWAGCEGKEGDTWDGNLFEVSNSLGRFIAVHSGPFIIVPEPPKCKECGRPL